MTFSIKNLLLSMASVAVLVAAPVGCQIGGTVSCDFRESTGKAPEPRCQERSGIQASTSFKAFCDGLGGKTADGPCPDSPILGCDISETEGTVVDWYYAPKTAEDVKTQCANDGGEIVNP